jgi:hypothetical protein
MILCVSECVIRIPVLSSIKDVVEVEVEGRPVEWNDEELADRVGEMGLPVAERLTEAEEEEESSNQSTLSQSPVVVVPVTTTRSLNLVNWHVARIDGLCADPDDCAGDLRCATSEPRTEDTSCSSAYRVKSLEIAERSARMRSAPGALGHV